MPDDIAAFYNDLSPYYSLIYEDWDASVQRQAANLDSLIKDLLPAYSPMPRRVLDAACGIGTQCLGLAALGYYVSASDLSASAVDMARLHATERDLTIDFSVGDLREAAGRHVGAFDVAMACDNFIAHLLSDHDIVAGLRALFECCRPGGVCVVSVRDYDAEPKSGQHLKPYGVRTVDGRRIILWQVWEYDVESPVYTSSFYVVEDDGHYCRTMVTRSRLCAVSPNHVVDLMGQAGFIDVQRFDDRFFQPVIVGRRPMTQAVIDDSWYDPAPSLRRRASTGGIVARVEADRVLVALTCEAGIDGYVLPKGGVDPGETIEEAARREIEEETGLTELTLIRSYPVSGRLSYERTFWQDLYYHLFVTTQEHGAPTDTENHPGMWWHPIDDLPPMLWPEQRRLVEDHRAEIVGLLRPHDAQLDVTVHSS